MLVSIETVFVVFIRDVESLYMTQLHIDSYLLRIFFCEQIVCMLYELL